MNVLSGRTNLFQGITLRIRLDSRPSGQKSRCRPPPDLHRKNGWIKVTDKPKPDFFRAILNAVPSPVFVVDADVRIHEFNEAAAPLLVQNPGVALQLRAGEALHCLHNADVEGGCGRGPHCGDCVIRNSVNHSFSGRKISRRATRMELVRGGSVRKIYVLITTSPFQYQDKTYALLILEDVSELMDLRSVIPICASCKKIRNDEEYWEHVEAYFKSHLDMDFSHGICPDCVKKLYPDLYAKLPLSEKVPGPVKMSPSPSIQKHKPETD